MVTYPKDWDESKLLDHVSLVQGLTYTPENVKPTGTLVLRSSNIQNGRLSLDDNVYVNAYVPEEKMVAQGDILVCVRNGSSALIGKSCVLPELKYTTFGAFMSVLRGDTTGYFAKLFESNIVQEQVRGRSNATINQITKKDFQSIQVTVPDKPEQEEIARTLSQFDTYIDDLAELIEKKKGIRDGALEELVRGTFTVDGQDLIWNETELNEVAFYRKGRTTSERSKYISTENMNQNFTGIEPYNGSEAITGCQFEKTDTLVANIRPYLKKIWFANFSGCCSADVLVIRAKEGMDSRLLYYLLANERFVNYVMSGGVKGIKMPRGDKEYIMHYPVRVPVDKSEQAIIANSLAAMDEEIEALEIERDKMIQIREGAMDDLLTGRVRLSV